MNYNTLLSINHYKKILLSLQRWPVSLRSLAEQTYSETSVIIKKHRKLKCLSVSLQSPKLLKNLYQH
jgi:hypothetical protein